MGCDFVVIARLLLVVSCCSGVALVVLRGLATLGGGPIEAVAVAVVIESFVAHDCVILA